MGFIDEAQLERLAQGLGASAYGEYIRDLQRSPRDRMPGR
jgi:hypothetical protein